jgi:nicotinamidase-related amidase
MTDLVHESTAQVNELNNFNLLIIDPQVDFCEKGRLAVRGATIDIQRIIQLIKTNSKQINKIFVSLDTHTKFHIGHHFFRTKGPEKKVADPGTTFIVVNDKDGTQRIMSNPTKETPSEEYEVNIENEADKIVMNKYAKKYIKMVGEKGAEGRNFVIRWPTHCIQGSAGWQINANLKAVLDQHKDKVEYHIKGQNQLAEMYSIMKAEVPYEEVIQKDFTPEELTIIRKYIYNPSDDTSVADPPNDPGTGFIQPSQDDYTIEVIANDTSNIGKTTEQIKLTESNVHNLQTTFNQKLFDDLIQDNMPIVVCGEALSHCVQFSTRDIVEQIQKEEKMNKVFVVQNASSPVVLDPESTKKFKESSYKFLTDMLSGTNTGCYTVANEGNLYKTTKNEIDIRFDKLGFMQPIRRSLMPTTPKANGGRKSRKNRKHKTRRPKIVKHSSRKHKKRTHRRNM